MRPVVNSRKWVLGETELIALAARIAELMRWQSAIIFLSGDLGAGKTTFARGFLRGLGYEGKVKSPTYTLVEPYEIEEKKVFHFDLYRIERDEELEEMGIRDYLATPALCLIEWPEKGLAKLPLADLLCRLQPVGEEREIEITAQSKLGRSLLAGLED